MADETKVEAQAAAEAPAKVAETVANTVETIAKDNAKVAKRTRAATVRRVKREAVAEKAVTRRTARKTRKTRKTRTAARKTAPKAARAAQKRIETVTNNFFNGFEAVPAFAPLQTIFADANERGQEFAKRGQKIAEELADLALDALRTAVESGATKSEAERKLTRARTAVYKAARLLDD